VPFDHPVSSFRRCHRQGNYWPRQYCWRYSWHEREHTCRLGYRFTSHNHLLVDVLFKCLTNSHTLSDLQMCVVLKWSMPSSGRISWKVSQFWKWLSRVYLFFSTLCRKSYSLYRRVRSDLVKWYWKSISLGIDLILWMEYPP
jgi:hypothetical protein